MGQRWCAHHHCDAKKDYIDYKTLETQLQSGEQSIQLMEHIVAKRKAFQRDHVHHIHRDDAHYARIQVLLHQRNEVLDQSMSDYLGMSHGTTAAEEPELRVMTTPTAPTPPDSSNVNTERLSRSQRRRQQMRQNKQEEAELLMSSSKKQSEKKPVEGVEHHPPRSEVQGLILLDRTPAAELYAFAFIHVLRIIWSNQKRPIERDTTHPVIFLALIKCTAFAVTGGREMMIRILDSTEDAYNNLAAHVGFIHFLVCESRAWGFPLPLNMTFIRLLGKVLGPERRDNEFERNICTVLLKTNNNK